MSAILTAMFTRKPRKRGFTLRRRAYPITQLNMNARENISDDLNSVIEALYGLREISRKIHDEKPSISQEIDDKIKEVAKACNHITETVHNLNL